jgi:hypothetical protein
MILTDRNLRELFLRLDPMAARAIARHVLLDKPSDESWAVLRWLRRRLKRKARAKNLRIK